MKKFFRSFLIPLTLVVAFAGLGNSVTYADDWFTDVSSDSSHYEAIKALTEDKVINGYLNNEFRPSNAIERQHGAVILSRLGKLTEASDVAAVLSQYKDIDTTYRYATEIATLTEAGVIRGYPDGNFNPNRSLTREQMATILVLALDLEQYDNGEDVQVNLSNVNEPHKKNVQILANLGVTDQLEDFRPKEAVTRGAFASFVHRALHADQYRLTVMHMNDTHARVEEMPKAITAIEQVRQGNPSSLLFHAGDAFSGTLYFNEYQGFADMTLLNLMGIDAMVFGNHEFDLGNTKEGHQALADFIKGSNFPLISANIDFSKDELLSPLVSLTNYTDAPELDKIHHGIIKEVDGEKIGIFGLTTESTSFVASPNLVEFSSYKKAAEEAVAYFESEGINKIIALTHIGYDSEPAVGNDLLLADLVDGIDIIVGGHSHDKLEKPVVITKKSNGEAKDPTLIVQADQYLTHLGKLDVWFDDQGVISIHNGKLIPLANVEGNAEALTILEPFTEKVKELREKEIGATLVSDLPNPRHSDSDVSVRADETALGNLIADGMLAKAKTFNPDTVIALQNGGGIRSHMDAGPITMGAVIEVLPFGNTLSLVTLTGAEIKDSLENSVRNAPGENGGFLQVAGLKYTFDSDREVGDRVVAMQVKIGDEYVDVELDGEYVVATNAFTVRGGDDFETLGQAYEDGRVEDLGFDDWVTFHDYLVELGTVEGKIEGRIVDLAKNKDD